MTRSTFFKSIAAAIATPFLAVAASAVPKPASDSSDLILMNQRIGKKLRELYANAIKGNPDGELNELENGQKVAMPKTKSPRHILTRPGDLEKMQADILRIEAGLDRRSLVICGSRIDIEEIDLPRVKSQSLSQLFLGL